MNHSTTFQALRIWLNQQGWLIIRDETKDITGLYEGAVPVPHTIIEAISTYGLAWSFTGEAGVVQAWRNQMSVDTEAM